MRVYDMIPVYEKQEDQGSHFASLDSYPREELEAAYEEITRLKNEGMLYTEDIYQKYMTDFKKRKTDSEGHFACILPMIVILPANTALRKRVSIMDAVR